jgi:thiamine biosynthesis lipoprotein
MKRRTFITASLGAMAATAASAWPPGSRLYTGAALGFGTTIALQVVHDNADVAAAAIHAGLRAAQRVDQLMSIYRPGSQVGRLNASGVLADPDPQLLAVLAQARQLSEWSEGAFDITVQPLWQAYSQAAAAGTLPSDAERIRARALADWRQVEFDRREVRLHRPGMAITLNGLAQGYAADMALAAVQAHGVRNALLDTGEFIARGQKLHRRPWALGIRDPRDAEALAATMQIVGCGVATSGDYATTFSSDYRHHHIFDPALGDSPTELASVTVMAPTALLADGLSTAFMVMGRQRAAALAARLPAVDLLTIDKQGGEWRSATFPPSAAYDAI